MGYKVFTRSTVPNTWYVDTDDGRLRVTSKRVKLHGEWVWRHTATKVGSIFGQCVGEAYSLTALAVKLGIK